MPWRLAWWGVSYWGRCVLPCLSSCTLGEESDEDVPRAGQALDPATSPGERVEHGAPKSRRFVGPVIRPPRPTRFRVRRGRRKCSRGFRFYEQSNLHLEVPSQAGVTRYFQDLASAVLPPLRRFKDAAPPTSGAWRRMELAEESSSADPPSVANVHFVHLLDDRRLDVLVCEMGRGQVYLLRPYEKLPKYELIGDNLGHPAPRGSGGSGR